MRKYIREKGTCSRHSQDGNLDCFHSNLISNSLLCLHIYKYIIRNAINYIYQRYHFCLTIHINFLEIANCQGFCFCLVLFTIVFLFTTEASVFLNYTWEIHLQQPTGQHCKENLGRVDSFWKDASLGGSSEQTARKGNRSHLIWIQ